MTLDGVWIGNPIEHLQILTTALSLIRKLYVSLKHALSLLILLSSQAPTALPPEKERTGGHWIGDYVGRTAGVGTAAKSLLSLPRIEPTAVEPVACRYIPSQLSRLQLSTETTLKVKVKVKVKHSP